MGPHVDAQERGVGRPRGEQPLSRSEAATDATERATREYLGRVAADPGMAAGLGFEGAEERSAEVVGVGDQEHERRTA
ncbi:MAG: hypothetical protein NTV21_14480 [Planctomycetota bacterium]|nr:hypothetical protein [Planctomycetota bacterium]